MMQIANRPDNLPKGYSWEVFTGKGRRKSFGKQYTIDDLLEYIRRTLLSTSPDKIVGLMESYLNDHPEVENRPAGWCARYILEHPELHDKLKHVSDGSYRYPRVFLSSGYSTVNTSLSDNFYRNMCFGTSLPVKLLPDDKEAVLQMFLEDVNREGVIFIQISGTAEEENI